MFIGELVAFDPANLNTYPSVCSDPGAVKDRFGFTGGEVLLFDDKGNYMGEVTKLSGLADEIAGKDKETR